MSAVLKIGWQSDHTFINASYSKLFVCGGLTVGVKAAYQIIRHIITYFTITRIYSKKKQKQFRFISRLVSLYIRLLDMHQKLLVLYV